MYELIEIELEGSELPEELQTISEQLGAYVTNDSMYFHSKIGFTEVGCFHNSGYKFGRWYDMIWMEKMIGPHDAHPGEVHFGEWNVEIDDERNSVSFGR